MYFDDAEGMVFRPPSEAESFILRVTIGCSHNECTFCTMYRGVQFRVRKMEDIENQIEAASMYGRGLRRVFLADGNALALPTKMLLDILNLLKKTFPKLTRVSCYGGPKDILRKSKEDLELLYDAGLHLLYLGIESGDDSVLLNVHKGVNSKQMIEAGQKVLAAGMKLSVMIILGLGGQKLSLNHAINTAKVISMIQPNMLSALTLMLPEDSELRRQVDQGNFIPLSPYQQMVEIKRMIQEIRLEETTHCIFRSNHISNRLPLAGVLPKDQEKLLSQIDQYIELLKNENDPTYNDIGGI